MKRTTITYLILLSFICSSTVAVANNYASDQVIVRFEPNTPPSEITDFLNQFNLMIVDGSTPVLDFYLTQIDPGLGWPTGINYNNYPDSISGIIAGAPAVTVVNSIGLNYFTDAPLPFKGEATEEGHDPLDNCGAFDFSINTNGIGSHFVKGGIFDTGIILHPQFSEYFDPNNIGVNFIEPMQAPLDFNGHGTHMTSTMVLDLPPSTNATLEYHAYKTHNSSGTGTVWHLIEALDEAIAEDIKVVNMSLNFTTAYDHRFDPLAPLQIAIEEAKELAGILVVAAAGNNGNNNDNPSDPSSYPASYLNDNIIAVTAVNCDYMVPAWANVGPTSVDIAAPGVDIWGLEESGHFILMDGTSSATAFVSRVAALLGTFQSVFDYVAIKCAILTGAEGSLIIMSQSVGNGYLDAANAQNILLGSAPCEIPPPSNGGTDRSEDEALNYTLHNGHLLTINAPKEQLAEITVFNSLGQVLSSSKMHLAKGNTQYELNLDTPDNLSVYFLNIRYGNQSKTLKFVH